MLYKRWLMLKPRNESFLNIIDENSSLGKMHNIKY